MMAQVSRALLLMVAITVQQVRSEGSSSGLFGMLSTLEKYAAKATTFKKLGSNMVNGMPVNACKEDNCCKASKCGHMPGFSCSTWRGTTECKGSDMFPIPTLGHCFCKTAACGIDGACLDSAAAHDGTIKQKAVATQHGLFGTLKQIFTSDSHPSGKFEEHDDKPEFGEPEDFTLVFMAYGVFFVSLVTGAGVLIRRRMARGASAVEETLTEDYDLCEMQSNAE